MDQFDPQSIPPGAIRTQELIHALRERASADPQAAAMLFKITGGREGGMPGAQPGMAPPQQGMAPPGAPPMAPPQGDMTQSQFSGYGQQPDPARQAAQTAQLARLLRARGR